ncbi:MAG: hypothetical protein RLY31_1188 [Bacteroidota bacterium]|jgi:L-ribulokinase
MEMELVIGLDFGTDSVRAVLVDTANGAELSSNVHWYERWMEGRYCLPEENRYRQHPLDHLEGMERTVREVLALAGVAGSAVRGICVDTTGSSPVAVSRAAVPLSLMPEHADDPDAMVVLWKDHSALWEAEAINRAARTWGEEDFTRYEGGIYSSEWFWAKIWHIIRRDGPVRRAAYSWMEHCDLMTAVLTGCRDVRTLRRSRCAAGHKAMWHPDWDGLPPADFLGRLHPDLAVLRERLYRHTYTSDQAAGTLCAEWADRLGLSTDTVVAVGTFDAHAGAVGVQVEKGTLVKVMGTSTCDMMVASRETIAGNTVKGICGQVDGSILPDMVGLEAGQSAFGDLLAWFRTILCWPLEQLSLDTSLSPAQAKRLAASLEERILDELARHAASLPLTEDMPVALDWINGRRTPDANQALTGAVMGLTLGTDAPRLFQALVHAICFGSRRIVARFEAEGIPIRKVVGVGGVARKSPYVMQTLANVLQRPVEVAATDHAPALGAAIYAAVAAGLYPDVATAAAVMASRPEAYYPPQPELAERFDRLLARYDALGRFVESQTAVR